MQRSCTVPAHILAISGFFFLNVHSPVRGQCSCPCPADLTGNTLRDGLDVDGFVKCVLNGPSVGPSCSCADMNADSVVDQLDIPFFASTILSPGICTVTQSQYEPGPLDTPPASPCREGRSCGGAPDRGVANSLYLFNGEVFQSAVDLQVAGRGLDFAWARKYRSRNGPTTAMGAGWDYSYNIYLEPAGPNYILHDGNTRADLYTLQANGKWARDEYFRELQLNGDGTYTLVFANNGKWNLRSLVAPIAPGRIDSIIDRNSNAISFAYDAQGRLVTITDALSSPFTLAYDASNRITSVNDFTGRQVVYTYDANGDLRTVRSPIVTGTPNGNDYPGGKITSYTYSSGFSDNRLNHNLLTITDPRGQTYLVNTYASTLNPSNLYFDRLIHQVWGDPGDIIDVVYVPQSGCSGNNFAVMKSIVNDRVGDVKEFYYDGGNRLVMAREFTGRANPDLPTTESSNRPTGKLRPSDPDYFETRWSYNADSMPTLTTYPNLNTTSKVYELALDPNAARRMRGNLRQLIRTTGPLGGDQASITESYTYETGFGGCGCGSNFVKTHTDGRGNTESHTYDATGNRTHTDHFTGGGVEDWTYNIPGQVLTHTHPANGSGNRRVESYSYYFAGPQSGYLQSVVIDSGGFALTTQHEYDARGNVIRKIHPSGADTLFTYNQLDQIVRELSREVTAGSGIRYEKLTWYDANNNIIRVDVENRDENGILLPNTHWTTIYEHGDILNRIIRTCAERLDAFLANGNLSCGSFPFGSAVSIEYQYDANRNRTLTRYGQATNGSDPANTLTSQFDERDLPFKSTLASGSPAASTDQTDYDGNGNTKTTSQGLESAPRITQYIYDGYNRRTSSTDAMGNISTSHYDANGNLTSQRIDGELQDVPGSASNIRLSDITYQYDAMDRRIREDVAHFDTQTQAIIGDGFSITQWTYADNSQITSTTMDIPGHVTTYFYDTANRLLREVDAKNNQIENAYDSDSNLTQTVEIDKSDLANPSQNFTTTYTYDQLDRRLNVVNNMSNTHQYAYDSRNNRVFYIDARNNQTRYSYDGLNRLVQTDRLVPTQPDGHIITQQSWDDDSRLSGQSDDNGNTTSYVYDSLNRKTGSVFADCTSDSIQYDVHDNATQTTDENGTVVNYSYDSLNRCTNKNVISFAPAVSMDTTFENYAYDGRSRIVSASDNDTLVTRNYDSLSDVLRDGQQMIGVPGGVLKTIIAQYDGERNLVQLNYAGARTVAYSYDTLDRPLQINDIGPFSLLANYWYIGPYRAERRDYGNGTRLDLNYDGIRRTISTAHTVIAGGTLIDQRTYAWDPMNNKMFMDRPVPFPSEHHGYTYDAANRLIQSQLIAGGPPTFINYTLDGVGNRTNVSGGVCPGPGTGPYFMNATCCTPCDAQMNQYSSTPCLANVQYDGDGNATSASGPVTLIYDFRNRLVQFSFGGQTTTYRYDCFGRRVAKSVGAAFTRYLYTGFMNIADVNSAGTTVATYVDSMGPHSRLQMTRSSQKYFFHEDDQGSPVKVTNSSGSKVEGYSFDDFGAPHFFDGSGNPISQSAIGNPWLFQGQFYDPESTFYWRGGRNYLPDLDKCGQRSAMDSLGNASILANHNMVSIAVICPYCGRCSGCGHAPDCPLNNPPPPPPPPPAPVATADPWAAGPGPRRTLGIGSGWLEPGSPGVPPQGPSAPPPSSSPGTTTSDGPSIGETVVVTGLTLAGNYVAGVPVVTAARLTIWFIWQPVEPVTPYSPVGCKPESEELNKLYRIGYSCNDIQNALHDDAKTHCRHKDCSGAGVCPDGKPCRSVVSTVKDAEDPKNSRSLANLGACVWDFWFRCECGCPVK